MHGDEGARTSCALLLGTEVDLGAGGDPAFEPAFHRILLVYPLLALGLGGSGAPAPGGRGRGRGELTKVVK